MRFAKLLGVIIIGTTVIFTNVACERRGIMEDSSAPRETQQQNKISLIFEPVTMEDKIIGIAANEIQEVIQLYNIENNKYFIFIKKEDTKNLHSGVIIDKKAYDFGEVSMIADKNSTNLFSIEELKLYNKQLVKINGSLGANYAPTNYYYIDNQVPKLLLHSEGHTKEVDLNNDGVYEIVALTAFGVASSTDIYQYSNDTFVVVNLNKALDAITVYPKETDWKVFEAYFNNLPNQPKHYKYTQNALKEIK